MGVYICRRCDMAFHSKSGDCIPALDSNGEDVGELVNEDCATPAELYAYLPDFYPDPRSERCYRCHVLTTKETEDHTAACGSHGGK